MPWADAEDDVAASEPDPGAEEETAEAATVAAVAGGGVFGDHCSPVSDTTIIASMASFCNHIDHVRTQLPYALVVAAAAVLCGTLPVGFGAPVWPLVPLGCVVLLVGLRLVGKIA